jgi:hypothetical protein
MSNDRNHAGALRYRRLALAESDRERARLLNQIADEAERGILFTVDHLAYGSTSRAAPN